MHNATTTPDTLPLEREADLRELHEHLNGGTDARRLLTPTGATLAPTPRLLATSEQLLAEHAAYMADDSQQYPYRLLKLLTGEFAEAVAAARAK